MRNLRTYLAGIGSGGAMVGAVIAGFIALGTIVGFNGLPTSSADSNSAAVRVADSNAPEAAAAAAAGPAGAPAAAPAPTALAAAAAPGATPGTTVPGAPGTGGDDTIDVPDVPGGGDDGDGPSSVPGEPPPPPTPTPTDTNDVGGLVDEVDETVSDTTGLDLDLGGKTEGVTDIVDGAVGGLTGGRGLGLGDVELPNLTP